MMLKDLISNIAILIAFIYIGSQFLHGNGERIQLKQKVGAGLLAGGLATLLIFFPIEVQKGILVDFRYIPLILGAMYGGGITAIVVGTVIASISLLISGITLETAIAAAILLLAAIVCGYIAECTIKRNLRYLLMNMSCLFAVSIIFSILLDPSTYLVPLYLSYYMLGMIISTLTYKVMTRILQNRWMYQRYEELSKQDHLTGLDNAREFQHKLTLCLEQASRRNQELSLVLIDMDDFKKVNDTHGHDAGDVVLQQLSIVLSETCRSGDYVARVGGEEFAILLPNCSSHQALQIAERIRLAVERHSFVLPNKARIQKTISVGLATFPTVSADTLFKAADEALYVAKYSGRNRIIASRDTKEKTVSLSYRLSIQD